MAEVTAFTLPGITIMYTTITITDTNMITKTPRYRPQKWGKARVYFTAPCIARGIKPTTDPVTARYAEWIWWRKSAWLRYPPSNGLARCTPKSSGTNQEPAPFVGWISYHCNPVCPPKRKITTGSVGNFG